MHVATAEEVELGLGAIDYLRRQRSMQHLPDSRADMDGGKGPGTAAGGGAGYVSMLVNKAQ
eukprot:5023-Eustigmatos_ZCMA.PRE.1